MQFLMNRVYSMRLENKEGQEDESIHDWWNRLAWK